MCTTFFLLEIYSDWHDVCGTVFIERRENLISSELHNMFSTDFVDKISSELCI